MSDVTDIPILLDADTGYGNFNNARRLVRKLEERGVAGACMEDKLFPKTNSLLDGRAQPLADVEEFALKIKACKGVSTLSLYLLFFFTAANETFMMLNQPNFGFYCSTVISILVIIIRLCCSVVPRFSNGRMEPSRS